MGAYLNISIGNILRVGVRSSVRWRCRSMCAAGLCGCVFRSWENILANGSAAGLPGAGSCAKLCEWGSGFLVSGFEFSRRGGACGGFCFGFLVSGLLVSGFKLLVPG